jgi:hypothetical protein
MARFPYVDGEPRQQALEKSVSVFDRWRRDNTDIEALEVSAPGGLVRCWTSGLQPGGKRPLLLVMGGIVSTKEQWATVLVQARRLGMAAVVTELPGVGENTLRYDADSWRMLPRVLDACGEHPAGVYGLTMSFSGHSALRCAVEDSRIRGIVTAGAPISAFFTDVEWQRGLPRVTVDTLAHLTGMKLADLSGWALTGDQLAALDIPVCSIVSLRDEIIPSEDVHLLARHVSRTRFRRHDDVHGSPEHVAESRLWSVLSLLKMRGGRYPQRAVLGSLMLALRLRGARRER